MLIPPVKFCCWLRVILRIIFDKILVLFCFVLMSQRGLSALVANRLWRPPCCSSACFTLCLLLLRLSLQSCCSLWLPAPAGSRSAALLLAAHPRLPFFHLAGVTTSSVSDITIQDSTKTTKVVKHEMSDKLKCVSSLEPPTYRLTVQSSYHFANLATWIWTLRNSCWCFPAITGQIWDQQFDTNPWIAEHSIFYYYKLKYLNEDCSRIGKSFTDFAILLGICKFYIL